MTTPSLTWKQILTLQPCVEDRDEARKKLKATFADYATRELTLADAASAGVDFEGLVWIAGRAAERDTDCARRIRLFGADCAARVAHIANDPRSTAAIVASRAFARGEIDDAVWAAARAAAGDAAWAAGDAAGAAGAAAWAAASSAAGAAGDAAGAAGAAAWAAGAAAWAAARAAGDAAWAAWAAGDAAGDAAWAAWAAGDAEKARQRDRLVAWFSDNEPEDWPITEAQKADAA
jgi:hypothetical protein